MGEHVSKLVWESQQPLVISHLEHDERFPMLSDILSTDWGAVLCVLPLTTAHRRVGAMALGSVEASAYDAADLEFLQQVAAQVAVAVDNALNAQNAQNYQQELARERDRLRLLLEVNNALVSTLDLISCCRHFLLPAPGDESRLRQPGAVRARRPGNCAASAGFPQGKGCCRKRWCFR